MADPFVGEIRMFANNFAPRGWYWCEGGTVSIYENSILYAVINTYYGGDGRSTMGLPDLKGRAPMHSGTGPGLTERTLSEFGGLSIVTVTDTQLPAHDHELYLYPEAGTTKTATNNFLAWSRGVKAYKQDPYTLNVAMSDKSMEKAGGNQSHDNMQPYLGINFYIAYTGLFPSRN